MAKVMKIMKKIMFIAAAMVAAMTACVKEADVDTPIETPQAEGKVWVEFTAGAETKAALKEGDNSHQIVWEEDDEISINGETFKVTELTEGNLKATFGAFVSANFTAPYKAVYPASAGKTFEGLDIASTPSVVAGGFDDIVAVAYSEDASLQFKHVTSLIKFQIPADFPVNEVTISAGEALRGNVNVVMEAEDATPAIEVTSGKNEISLTGTFESGKNYYIPVLPGEKTNLTVRFNGYLSKAWSESTNIKQGRVANMGVLPAPVESGWVVKGIDGWTKDAKMYVEGNWCVARNVSSSTSEYKFNTGGDTGTWIGAKGSFIHGNYAYSEGGDNIEVSNSNTKYDFYYCEEGGMYMILPAGSSIDAVEVKTDMYLRGGCNDWGATAPTMHDGKFFGWKNLKFSSTPEFKFSTKIDGWNWQYSTESTLNINQWVTLKAGDSNWSNTKYSTVGTYDIYTTSDKLNRNKVVIVKSGDPIPAL